MGNKECTCLCEQSNRLPPGAMPPESRILSLGITRTIELADGTQCEFAGNFVSHPCLGVAKPQASLLGIGLRCDVVVADDDSERRSSSPDMTPKAKDEEMIQESAHRKARMELNSLVTSSRRSASDRKDVPQDHPQQHLHTRDATNIATSGAEKTGPGAPTRNSRKNSRSVRNPW